MAEINVIDGVMDGISKNIAMTPCEAEMVVKTAKDERTAILVKNTDSAKNVGVYIDAGNGLRSSIGGLLLDVPKGEMRAIMLDSMRFKKMNGVNCGKLVIKICKSGDENTAFDGTMANVSMAQLRL